jgi:glycosyltransferase involved in cell wall biosynthesis
MINLFLFLHDHSGAKTYADELLSYYETRSDLKIYKVYYASYYKNEFCVFKNAYTTEVHLPWVNNANSDLEKYSHNCMKLLHPIIEGKKNVIFHLNVATQVHIGLIAQEKYRVRLIYTLHFLPDYFSYMVYNKKDFLSVKKDLFLQQIAEKADQIICVTQFAKDVLCKCYNVPEEKVQAIHNGYGKDDRDIRLTIEDKIELKKELGFNPNDQIILFAGLLEDRKGVKYLVKAFSRLCETFTNARLVIVGDGKYTDVFDHAKGCRGKINLTGKIDQEELMQLYQVATIGVIPSVYEQCSYVALEMMKYGLPMVVADAPGLCELYKDYEDAIIVPLHTDDSKKMELVINPEELYLAIKILLDDTTLKNQFNIVSIEKWKNRYTNATMGENTVKEYYKQKKYS